MSGISSQFIRLATHPLKFRLFLLAKLPSAYFAGVRIVALDENKCVVTVPYKWFSRNPFRSTYFACLAMAGEMSTGALGMAYTYKKKPGISMLVVNVQAAYHKKAVGMTTFTCENGAMIQKMVEEAIQTGEARTITSRSTGRNKDGEIVAEVDVTWSFKLRKNK